MDQNLIVIGVFVAVIVIVVIKAVRRKPTSDEHGYRLRTPFMSPAERSFYGVLCNAVAKEYVVLAKVRVADIITPKPVQDRSKWQAAFNRISAKHFDYVLCDPKSLSVEHVVELHDRSHKKASRAKRDDLLRNACAGAGLSLTEFTAKSAYSIEEVRSEIIQSQSTGGVGNGRIEPSF